MKRQNTSILESSISGLFEIVPIVHQDHRGEFFEAFVQKDLVRETSVDFNVVQVNTSKSNKGVLRGAHSQIGKHAQRKLITVNTGQILDVVVDIRKDSPTFGQVEHFFLSPHEGRQLFLDSGLAHSFLALEEGTCVTYYCDSYYHPQSEVSVNPFSIGFDFQKIARDWDIERIIQSEKDTFGQDLRNFAP